MTERGSEAAQLSSSASPESPLARLVAEKGATMPRGDLIALARSSDVAPAVGPPSLQVLDERREERL